MAHTTRTGACTSGSVSMRGVPDYCDECEKGRMKVPYGYVCSECGTTYYAFDDTMYVERVWLHRKSKHSRARWMEKRVKSKVPMVPHGDLNLIVCDFKLIVDTIISESLSKGANLTRYDYYIIRIVSRNRLDGHVKISLFKDLCAGKRRDEYDDMLYGKVFPALSWDCGCSCPMYLNWRKRKGMGNVKKEDGRRTRRGRRKDVPNCI